MLFHFQRDSYSLSEEFQASRSSFSTVTFDICEDMSEEEYDWGWLAFSPRDLNLTVDNSSQAGMVKACFDCCKQFDSPPPTADQ
ncbi:hypothetical protein CEXT_255411 [Caerostris extrusa]|uniref:Uncharacterized protein n=1 Tax=Caerostris extrusa TaxID=172846 RepID=A0AAV4WMC7_CAEEX|nr:hypothetical protein CEXT_255411 [Caerostris extrusa]